MDVDVGIFKSKTLFCYLLWLPDLGQVINFYELQFLHL